MNIFEWRKTLCTGDLVSVRNRYLRSPNAIIEGIYPQDYNGERQWLDRWRPPEQQLRKLS